MDSSFLQRLEIRSSQVESQIQNEELRARELARTIRVEECKYQSQVTQFGKLKQKLFSAAKSEQHPRAVFENAREIARKLACDRDHLKVQNDKIVILRHKQEIVVDQVLRSKTKLEHVNDLLGDEKEKIRCRKEAHELECNLEALISQQAMNDQGKKLALPKEKIVELEEITSTENKEALPLCAEKELSDSVLCVDTPQALPHLNENSQGMLYLESSLERGGNKMAGEFCAAAQQFEQERGCNDSLQDSAKARSDFSEHIEELSSWKDLNDEGVNLTWVSKTGERFEVNITGTESGTSQRSLAVQIIPDSHRHQRVLSADKIQLRKALEDAGLKVSELVVGDFRVRRDKEK